MKKIESDMTGGELSDIPNDFYRKFFNKFNEIDTLAVDNWKVTHLLGYFCKKYKEQYQKDYKFKFNSPSPSKCFEVFQIKKLAMNLTANPSLLKEYIDWVYLNKVPRAKRKLTSISFINNEETVNEYKFNVLLADEKTSIDRSTLLPEKYKTVFYNTDFNINTYGDLAFVSQMSDMSPELIKAFSEIDIMGFDKNILSKIL